ncbi:hypothetical protein [Pseudomarimonas arenosa]|uniref:Uncharacterized protein n=1 Tax=Pseudomarimonas arenosa TaxID=2774145 RepID=A0AAW3ZMR1_9GAMM|nr:hypothetical protein [Pseudomarimonas arenosa]MBD8526819.1 hypothetical protein [Pseudomarimonas arenosa]
MKGLIVTGEVAIGALFGGFRVSWRFAFLARRMVGTALLCLLLLSVSPLAADERADGLAGCRLLAVDTRSQAAVLQCAASQVVLKKFDADRSLPILTAVRDESAVIRFTDQGEELLVVIGVGETMPAAEAVLARARESRTVEVPFVQAIEIQPDDSK